MDKRYQKAILNSVSGVKYHFAACMMICNVHDKFQDLLCILLNTIYYMSKLYVIWYFIQFQTGFVKDFKTHKHRNISLFSNSRRIHSLFCQIYQSNVYNRIKNIIRSYVCPK